MTLPQSEIVQGFLDRRWIVHRMDRFVVMVKGSGEDQEFITVFPNGRWVVGWYERGRRELC